MISTAILALPTWVLPLLIAVGALAIVGAVTCTVLIRKNKKKLKETPVEAVQPAEEEVIKVEDEKLEEPTAVPYEQPKEEVKEEKPVEEKKPLPIIVRKAAPEGKVFIRVRYSRSFTAKLIQASDTVKSYYEEIKNELMRYKVHSRVSWKYETFRKGRKLLVKLAIRGKSLYVYYALDPNAYADTKYKVKDVSEKASHAAVPTLYKIKNDRRCRYAKKLIADVMAANELVAGEERHENYAAQYPYEELEPLIERNLIKFFRYEEAAPDAEEGIIAVPIEALPENAVHEDIAPTAEPEPVRVPPEGKVLIRVRYNRSYTAKLIQSNDTVKDYYTEIKNELMRYKVHSRVSWKHETFRKGRKLLVKLTIRGKSLYVYYALDPKKYEDTKYKIKDVSSVASNAEVPTQYKIKNDRRCRYAKQLIAEVMAENELLAGEERHENYTAQYPYEEIEPLIERKLVKLVPWKETVYDSEVGVIAVAEHEVTEEIAAAAEPVVEPEPEPVVEPEPEPEPEGITVAEAEEQIPDEEVEKYVVISHKFSDKSKKAIVNIDTLGKYFKDGETVTVEDMKERVPEIGSKVTFVKVLARGRLNKALTVEADDFSPAAIKMIVLTGGTVIRKKTNAN